MTVFYQFWPVLKARDGHCPVTIHYVVVSNRLQCIYAIYIFYSSSRSCWSNIKLILFPNKVNFDWIHAECCPSICNSTVAGHKATAEDLDACRVGADWGHFCREKEFWYQIILIYMPWLRAVDPVCRMSHIPANVRRQSMLAHLTAYPIRM